MRRLSQAAFEALIDRLFDRNASALDRLSAAKELREYAEELERVTGREAHEAGSTWGEIGTMYGASKQAMAQRFATRESVPPQEKDRGDASSPRRNPSSEALPRVAQALGIG